MSEDNDVVVLDDKDWQPFGPTADEIAKRPPDDDEDEKDATEGVES